MPAWGTAKSDAPGFSIRQAFRAEGLSQSCPALPRLVRTFGPCCVFGLDPGTSLRFAPGYRWPRRWRYIHCRPLLFRPSECASWGAKEQHNAFAGAGVTNWLLRRRMRSELRQIGSDGAMAF